MTVVVMTTINSTQAMAEEPRPPRPSCSVNLTAAVLTFQVGATVGAEFEIAAVASLSVVAFEIGAVVGLAVVAVEVGIVVVGCLSFLADTKSNESALNLSVLQRLLHFIFASYVPSTLQTI